MAAVRHGVGRETAHEAIKEHAVAVALEMRETGPERNDLLDRLAADERLGVSRADLDEAIARSAGSGRYRRPADSPSWLRASPRSPPPIRRLPRIGPVWCCRALRPHEHDPGPHVSRRGAGKRGCGSRIRASFAVLGRETPIQVHPLI